MSRQRPPWDQAGLPSASRTGVLPNELIHGSWRTGGSRNEQRPAVVLVGASIALHLALGAVTVLMIRPARVTEEAPHTVEMVFDAAPAPPAQVPAPTAVDGSPGEPAKAVQDTLAEVPPQPPPAEPPALPASEPAMPPVAEPPPQPAPSQAPPLAEPSPTEVEPPPSAVAPVPKPQPSEPVKLDELDRQALPAPPLMTQVPIPATPTPVRPPPRPRPAPHAVQQPSVPAVAAAPPLTASLPEPARRSSAPPGTPPPAPLSPTTAAPAPSPTGVNGAWRNALATWVQSRKRYPDEARRQNTEGQVAVRFTVGRDGQVLDAQVVHGSGSDLLDQAALSMFRGGRAPSFPPDMAQTQITTTISVRYRLAE